MGNPPSPLHVEQQESPRPVLMLEVGDRLQLTRALVQLVLKALKENQGHLVVAELKRNPDTRLVTITLRQDQ